MSETDKDTDLFEAAAELACSAKRGSAARDYSQYTAGNIAAHREALVEEIEALRLTLIALFLPLAQAVVDISHLESDIESLRADLAVLPAKIKREQRKEQRHAHS